MKTFKSIISIALVSILLLCSAVSASAKAPSSDGLMFNNLADATGIFRITEAGVAKAFFDYTGHYGIITGAVVTTKIQKKILFWWVTVDTAEWTDYFTIWTGHAEHFVVLESSGNYRAVFDFTVSGTNGSDDVTQIICYDTY